MKTKHTPGPWTAKFFRNTGLEVRGQDTRLVYEITEPLDAEDGANAHLIAAAPEMLEALEKAADLISAEYCSHGDGCDENKKACYISDILKVINKARGVK